MKQETSTLLRDQGKALELYTRAAALGSSMAHFTLGNIFVKGGILRSPSSTMRPPLCQGMKGQDTTLEQLRHSLEIWDEL